MQARRPEVKMRFANAVGTCQLDDLPGCTQVCVSHSVFVLPQFRGKGEGKRNHQLRLERMQGLKYDCAICTVASHNEREKHILREYGWRKIYQFHSSKTGSVVELWVRDFDQQMKVHD